MLLEKENEKRKKRKEKRRIVSNWEKHRMGE